jgi:hypothetical protein
VVFLSVCHPGERLSRSDISIAHGVWSTSKDSLRKEEENYTPKRVKKIETSPTSSSYNTKDSTIVIGGIQVDGYYDQKFPELRSIPIRLYVSLAS